MHVTLDVARPRMALTALLFLPPLFTPGLAGPSGSLGAQTLVEERPVEAVLAPVVPQTFEGDLRDLAPASAWSPGMPIDPRGAEHRESAELLESLEGRDPVPPRFPLPARPDPLLTLQSGAPAPGPGLLLGPFLSFEGLTFTGVNPPDTVGAVGPDHFVQMVNGTGDSGGASFAVWDKRGRQLTGRVALRDLWPGGACRDLGRGDPIVLHDEGADRWILTEVAVSLFPCIVFQQDCHLCVAVSRTPDPVTGGFHLYDFPIPGFPDYPKYAASPDAYYVGTNHIDDLGQRAGAYALERQAMLTGQAARAQIFTAPRIPVAGFIQSLLPAVQDGGTPARTEAPGLFLRYRDGELAGEMDLERDALEIWELRVDWEDPSSSALIGPQRVEVADFDSTIFNVPQPEPSPTPLATFSDPLMWRVTHRDFGDREVLVGNFTVDASGTDQAGIRWFELRRQADGSWATFQEGTFAPDIAHRWMGSAAMDGAGNLLLGYSVTSPELHIFPSLRVAGRRAADPPGALPQGELELATGLTAQGTGLWGDYSALTVDPKDDCTFWYTHQTVREDGSWSTRVGTFRFATCRSATRPPER